MLVSQELLLSLGTPRVARIVPVNRRRRVSHPYLVGFDTCSEIHVVYQVLNVMRTSQEL